MSWPGIVDNTASGQRPINMAYRNNSWDIGFEAAES